MLLKQRAVGTRFCEVPSIATCQPQEGDHAIVQDPRDSGSAASAVSLTRLNQPARTLRLPTATCAVTLLRRSGHTLSWLQARGREGHATSHHSICATASPGTSGLWINQYCAHIDVAVRPNLQRRSLIIGIAIVDNFWNPFNVFSNLRALQKLRAGTGRTDHVSSYWLEEEIEE